MPITRDQKSRSSAAFSLNPATISSNTTTSGNGVDVSSYAAVIMDFQTGTRTDGTYTPNVQESDDNSTWTNVEAYDLIGSETAITASNTIVSVGYNGSKKYVRGQLVSTSVTSGCTACACVVRGFTS